MKAVTTVFALLQCVPPPFFLRSKNKTPQCCLPARYAAKGVVTPHLHAQCFNVHKLHFPYNSEGNKQLPCSPFSYSKTQKTKPTFTRPFPRALRPCFLQKMLAKRGQYFSTISRFSQLSHSPCWSR